MRNKFSINEAFKKKKKKKDQRLSTVLLSLNMLILAEALLRNVSSVSVEDSFCGTLTVSNMHLNTTINQQSRCVKCV